MFFDTRNLFFLTFLISVCVSFSQKSFAQSADSENSEPKTKSAAQILHEDTPEKSADLQNLTENKIFGEKTKSENIEKNSDFGETEKPEAENFKSSFRPTATEDKERSDFDFLKNQNSLPHSTAANSSKNHGRLSLDDSFQWRSAIGQSLLFLGVQHGYAFTQPKTREALKGKFFKDYAESVKSLHGWDDGGRFFTNYIAHPMQGALTGFIYVQNSPKEKKLEFGNSADYWRSRLKAMVWTTAWSTQFEIGPISQASIGNVGLKGKQTWEDIIVTPTLGTAMLVAEDAVDRFIMKNMERRFDNFYLRIFARMILSPSRNFSNLLRFKPPWHRDRPIAH